MIRLVLFLVFLAALAFAGAWLADRPGEISVVWQGWNIQTTVPVALAALALLTGVMMVLWRAFSLLVRSPQLISAFSTRRRKEKGWNAVTRGLLAIGTGDAAGARSARAEAARLLPDEPLTQLLSAQTAQFEGNRDLAIAHFRAMADKPSTRLLGLRGLHMEARRAGDLGAASAFAEEAATTAPALGWAADAVIESRCADGDFAGARAVLERQMAQKGIDKAQYRRRRAVLLAAEAVALEHSDPHVARERAVEAVRLAPTLVPAAAVAGRLLGAAGDMKKAAKIVETAFAANPHPELAEVEAYLRPGDAAKDRLKRIRILAGRAPSHRESAIALAHAAIDAHEFKQARLVLEPLLEEPSQRVCLLMAELEAAEHADIGKAREWTARAVRATRDPAWIADGVVSDHWAPISPVSGKLDAFVWAVPPGVSSTPILEHEAERVKAAIAAVRASEEAKAAAIAAEAEARSAAQVEVIAPPPVETTATEPAVAEAPPPSAAKPADPEPQAAKPAHAGIPTPVPGEAEPAKPADAKPAGAKLEPTKSAAAKPEGTRPAPADLPPAKADAPRREGTEPDSVKSGAKAEAVKAPPPAAPADESMRPIEVSSESWTGLGEHSGASAQDAEERVVRLPPPQMSASSPAQGSASPQALRSAEAASRSEATTRTATAVAGAAIAPATSGSPSPVPAANDRRRPSRVEPIIAMPPLPDDPGPEPDEPEEPQPPGRRSRFLGL